LASLKSEGEVARQAQQALSAQHTQCKADNAKLYSTGVELLERYEGKGLGEVFSSKEPFLQLGRVTLENVGAQYAEALKAAKLKP
jgi:NADPH-dependent curcumin reductase CurA